MNDLSFVKDASGRFYAGMTIDEARKNGTDKSVWRRDFHNLDRNKDGILSVNEIMNERNRSSKLNKWGVCGIGLLGLLDLLSNRDSKGWMLADLIIDGFLIISCARSAYKIDNGTKRIEEELLKRSQGENLSIDA